MTKKYTDVTDAEVLLAKTDRAAQGRICTKMVGLIDFFLKRMHPRNDEEAEDLRQEGLLGLLRAITTYKVLAKRNPNTTSHFKGWASYWVRAFMQRARYGATHQPVKPLNVALSLNVSEYPQHHEMSEDDWLDTLPSDSDPIAEVLLNADKKTLAWCVSTLTATQQTVYKMRMREESLEDIGHVIGTSRERVRQILFTQIYPKLTRMLLERLDDDRLPTLGDLPFLRKGGRAHSSVAVRSREGLLPRAPLHRAARVKAQAAKNENAEGDHAHRRDRGGLHGAAREGAGPEVDGWACVEALPVQRAVGE